MMNSERRGFLGILAAWIGGLVLVGHSADAGGTTTTPSVHSSTSRTTPSIFEMEEARPPMPHGFEAILIVGHVAFEEETCTIIIHKRWLILPKGCIGPEA